MRDGFGIPRDQVIIKAKKEPERTSALPSTALAASGLTAGAAGKVMYDEKREVGNQEAKWGQKNYKRGRKGLKQAWGQRSEAIRVSAVERDKKNYKAGGNGSLKRIIGQEHQNVVDSAKANYQENRKAPLKALKASKGNAARAAVAHGQARKAAIIGGAVAAPLLGAAVLTRPKEKVMKDAFGISKADRSQGKPTAGRRVAAQAGGVLHPVVAGREGKKIQATGNTLVGSVGGGMLGQVAGGTAGALLSQGKPSAMLAGSAIGGVGGSVAGTDWAAKHNNRKGYLKPQTKDHKKTIDALRTRQKVARAREAGRKEAMQKDAFGVERDEVSKAGPSLAAVLKPYNSAVMRGAAKRGEGPTQLKRTLARSTKRKEAAYIGGARAWNKGAGIQPPKRSY
jgi:hypothetical protein